jgi:YVTN family beta-propeller protein
VTRVLRRRPARRGGRRRPRRGRGVQDVVGTIIILAIAVVLAGIVTLWVNTYPIQTANRSDLFSVNLTYGGSTCVLGCGSGMGHGSPTKAPAMNGIHIELLAGPRIVGTSTTQSSVRLASQQVPSAFSTPFTLAAGLGGSSSWSPGETWSLNLTQYGLPFYDNLTIIVDSNNEVVMNSVAPGPNALSPPYFTSESAIPNPVASGSMVNISATIIAPDGLNTSMPPATVFANLTEINVGGANRPIAEIGVGTSPDGVAVDTSNGYAYVADSGSGRVSVFNASSYAAVGTITVHTHPEGVAYDGTDSEIFVTNNGSASVSVISDSNDRVVATVTVGTDPDGVAFDSTNDEVYVTNYGSNSVSVITPSNNRVQSTITVGTHPSGIAFDSANGYLYVANQGSNSVSVINGATNVVASTITVGTQPDGVGFDAANGDIYVTNVGANTVSVISGSTGTVVATVHTGKAPEAAAWASSTGDVYVADYSQNNVTIINGSSNKVLGAINVGTEPEAITYDASNQTLFTANYGSNNVTAITTTNLLLLPLTQSISGGNWYVDYTVPAATPAGTYYVFLTAVDNIGLTAQVSVPVVVS